MRKAKAAVQGTIYKKRLIFLLVIFSLAAVALVLRVAWLQFADGEDLKKKAYQQQNSRRTISPDRGTIYDRNGKELAISVQVGTITCNPKDVKKNEKPVSEIADGLAAILEMNSSDVLNLITKDSQYAVIRKKVDLETEEKLKEWLKTEEVSGISIDDDAKRYYPNSSLASHVIGFTGADNQGLAGMESMMEKYLKGVPGKIISEVDAKGKALPLTTEERIEAQDGLNVVLTIDENIQYIAEKTLSEAISQYKVKQGGVCIVMDPRNGEILAMVSKPDYDLNQPFAAPAGIEGIDPATWDGTSNDAVKILNKTVW
ncbi:MAG: peptidoglycan glycosyltransferase, partial [Clostridiales bacterium]|nr:peptidoglycan glycosyltransferase [Clostridiales bacterium]